MPRRDQTGPMGAGPMSGWGLGNCSGNAGTVLPGRGNGAGLGRGLGQGRGSGRAGLSGMGWCRRFFSRGFGFGPGRGGAFSVAQLDKDQETEILRQNAQVMERELDAIKKRLEEIDNP